MAYTNDLFQNFPTPLSVQKKVMVRPLQTIYNLNEITSFSSVLKGVSMDPSIPPPPHPDQIVPEVATVGGLPQ